MAPLHRFTSSPHALLLVLAVGAMLCASPGAAAASPRPVLLVIANDDFHHAEFSALRAAMKTRGVPVVVAAGALRPATAQDPGSTPPVFPQRALASDRPRTTPPSPSSAAGDRPSISSRSKAPTTTPPTALSPPWRAR